MEWFSVLLLMAAARVALMETAILQGLPRSITIMRLAALVRRVPLLMFRRVGKERLGEQNKRRVAAETPD
jgi:hypothetical protein